MEPASIFSICNDPISLDGRRRFFSGLDVQVADVSVRERTDSMKMTLGKRLFLYSSAPLIALLLFTFFGLAQTQTVQWERHFRAQCISFARLATPELLKRFRGEFGAGKQEQLAFLAFNRDLVDFSVVSWNNRPLFQSVRFPDFIDLDLENGQIQPLSEFEPLADGLVAEILTLKDGRRILVLTVPAQGPTGETVLLVRYRLSYDAVEERIHELRRHLLLIAAVSCVLSLLFAALLARRVARPLKALTDGAESIRQGRLDARIAVIGDDEIGTLGNAFNRMVDGLQQSREEVVAKHTALENANLELRRVQEQLIRSERLAAIGQLAAGVSHEIDNPVGIILGYAELLLEDTPPGDPRHEDLLAIVDECKRCRRITGGLLGFARSSRGEYARLDLVALVRQVVASLQPQRLFKYLEIDIIATQGELMAFADADQLRQVLVNLLLNAAQAMGGTGQLVIALEQSGDECRLTVDDSGPGIPFAERERIFEPFVSTKGCGEGTGLGLSICRRLVEEHGGRLTAAVAPSGGARFLLVLPLNLSA